ncbi:hypothetical protein BGZ94_009904 [Podila epigama]|nr:hypothetical protein BGZ94_009904 [Podila epigama]
MSRHLGERNALHNTLGVNEHTELDWRYLSAADACHSEYYSSHNDGDDDDEGEEEVEEEEEEEQQQHQQQHQRKDIVISSSSLDHLQHARTLTRPTRRLLVPYRSILSSASASATASNSTATATKAALSNGAQVANDSTDTIKNMRARALDKINGRSGSTLARDAEQSRGHTASSPVASSPQANSTRPSRGSSAGNIAKLSNSNNVPHPSKKQAVTSSSSGTARALHRSASSIAALPSSTKTEQEDGASTGQNSGSKVKRRSFGLNNERITLPRITTKFAQADSQHHSTATATITPLRKRNSGSFKRQQALSTSEDEQEAPAQSIFQGRARFASESGGILLSELKALKARVQELEMERMNRSLSLSAQSPLPMTPKSMDRSPREEESSPRTHSEKLQSILQRHRGSSASTSSSSPLRSPVTTAVEKGSLRNGNTLRSQSTKGSATPSKVSTLSDSTLRTGARVSTTSTSSSTTTASTKTISTTRHITLLQETFKAFEKAMVPLQTAGSNSYIQGMGNAVQNAVSMNQTIRTLIKADVSLVDSPAMTSLQRASDDQIRSLTEALLGLTTTVTATVSGGAFDRTITPNEALVNSNAPVRSYSPRISGPTQERFSQGQRLSLGLVGEDLEARARAKATASTDHHHRHQTFAQRPYSSTAESTGTMTPNARVSSGYPSRTNSIASLSSNNDLRDRGLNPRQGYTADYGYETQPGYAGHGLALVHPVAIDSVASREPPPQHEAQANFWDQGQDQDQDQVQDRNRDRDRDYRQGVKNSPVFSSSTPLSIEAPRFASPGLSSIRDNDSVVSEQVVQSQTSVRNILTRYSQMTPTQGRFSRNDQGQGEGEGQGQDQYQFQDQDHDQDQGYNQDHDRDQAQAQAQEQIQEQQVMMGRNQNVNQNYGMNQERQEHARHRQLRSQKSSQHLPEPTMISDQQERASAPRGPLLQQDSRLHGHPNEGQQPGPGRGLVRQMRPHMFSEDEGTGWGTASAGQLDSRSRPPFSQQRYQQHQSQHKLQQVFDPHRQDDADDQRFPAGYFERAFQQDRRGFSDGEVPMTGQQVLYRTRQGLQPHHHQPQHNHQNYQNHHHQDMAITTPSLSSPTSSPSSSSRLEGPSSLASSNGVGGVGGRYHLSPRSPAHPSTFPRQQSLVEMGNSQLKYRVDSSMADRLHRVPSYPTLDGLSPQAHAQFGHILGTM